jgi:hypothetical protein
MLLKQVFKPFMMKRYLLEYSLSAICIWIPMKKSPRIKNKSAKDVWV